MKGNVWEKVLERIGQTGSVRRHDWHSWLMPTTLGDDRGEEIEVRVPRQDIADWIGRHYMTAIQEALAAEGRGTTKVQLVVGPAVTERINAGRRKGMQGRDIDFEATDPWDDPVDGAALLTELAQAFERFIALPPYASTALALWVLHTYTHEVEFCSPVIGITSPFKGCGKTTVLNVLRTLVHRGLPISNLTGSTMFRTIDAYEPTLLIDEADTFLRDNEQLRGLLNSGHTRDTAWLIRNVGDDYLPRKFSTWCPKAIAAIDRLPGTLEDRSIHIRMKRQSTDERGQRAKERFRSELVTMRHLPLRRRAMRWSEDHVDQLPRLEPAIPSSLPDRAGDCWRPLLRIADVAGGEWPARARGAAQGITGAAFKDEQEPGVELLRDLYGLLNPDPAQDGLPVLRPDAAGMITTEEIVAGLLALGSDRPWSTWRAEKPITPRALSDLLRPLGCHGSGYRKIGDKLARGYRKDVFDDAFSRYLPIEVIKCCTPNVYAGKSRITSQFQEAEKNQSDHTKTPDFIGRTALDHFETGKTGKSTVLPLVPALERQLRNARNLKVQPPVRQPERAAATRKGRVN